MKINIAHLYGNLLNTYGDIGNIMQITHMLKNIGYDVNVHIISLKDRFDPNNYDFVFFGGGQDYEQRIVQKDLMLKKEAIRDYIENDGVFLAICGGYQLLGKYYYDAYDNLIEGLNIFDHYTKNHEGKLRFTGNVKIRSSVDETEIYEGFENHGGITFLAENQKPFGIVIEGNGNNGEDKTEGFRYKNTIGTYLHGPLLPRNPNLSESLLEIIVNRRKL